MPIVFNQDVTPETVFTTTGGGTVFSANRTSTVAYDLFSDTAVVNDAIYIGRWGAFGGVKFNIGTAMAYTSATFAYEYWNGSAWTALSGVTDGTGGFTVTGQNYISWNPNNFDMRGTAVNSNTKTYVRIRIAAISGLTEGGANATSVAKAADWTISITGYTSGVPANCTDIYNADVAGGWGQVTLNDQYFKSLAHIRVGDGTTASYFKELNKTIQIGDSTHWRNFDELLNGDIQLGSAGVGLPNYRTLDSCVLRMYGNNTTYPVLRGYFKMYGGMLCDGGSNSNYSWWFAGDQGNGTQELINVNIANKRVVFSGGFIGRRITLQYGVGFYFFTNTSAIWEDLKVTTAGINTDPGYNPTIIDGDFNNSAWLQIYSGTTAVYGTELNLISCSFYNFDSVANAITNTNYRHNCADKKKIDVIVSDENRSPLSGATVKVERYDSGSGEWFSEQVTDSLATNSAALDYLTSWGNTSLTVSDGTKFAIGNYIKIFTEWYKVTNIVGNVLTIERAKYGTYLMSVASTGNKIYKQATSVSTGADGRIPQVTALRKQRFAFGTNTPAPYNDATWRTVNNDTYRIVVSKDGYETETIGFTLDENVVEKVTLKTAIPKLEDDRGNVFDRVDKTNSGTTNLRRKLVKV